MELNLEVSDLILVDFFSPFSSQIWCLIPDSLCQTFKDKYFFILPVLSANLKVTIEQKVEYTNKEM